MAVENRESQTQDQINRGNEAGNQVLSKLTNQIEGDVLKSLSDLIPDAPQEKLPVQEEQVEEEVEEVEEVAQEEEVEEETQEEELIPKSKIQPRFDKLNARIKALESQVENQQVKQSEEKPSDETTEKLRKMSNDELRVLKRQVEVAKLEAHSSKNQKQLDDLLDLQEKIEDTVRSAPQRFLNAQNAAYSKMADKLAQGIEHKELEKATPEIIKKTNEILQKHPHLYNDVNGKALALEIAVEQYKELSKFSLTKKSVSNLKSQVNTLKRKTSLDNGASKTVQDVSVLDNVRRAAHGGTTRDKQVLVREDPRFRVNEMIPTEYQ